MFDDFQENAGPRKPRTAVVSVLSLIVGIVIGVVLVLGWQSFHPGVNSASVVSSTVTSTQESTPNAPSNGKGSGPTAKDNDRPQYFWDTVKSQVAQGMQLSADQVKTKLQTGLHIQDVAAAQGISQDQLHTIEINAFQAADNAMVSHGFTTQQNIGYDMQRWRQEEVMQLNGDVTNVFLQR